MNRRKVFSALLLVVIVSACASLKNDWQTAKTLNTPASYEKFLIDHPKSEFEQEARKLMEVAYWEKTLNLNSINSYDSYLKKYPNGLYVNEAMVNVETIEFNIATKEGTFDSYNKYLSKYPKTSRKDEILVLLDDLTYLKSKELNDFNFYLDKYPKGKHSDEIHILSNIFNGDEGALDKLRSKGMNLYSSKDASKLILELLIKCVDVGSIKARGMVFSSGEFQAIDGEEAKFINGTTEEEKQNLFQSIKRLLSFGADANVYKVQGFKMGGREETAIQGVVVYSTGSKGKIIPAAIANSNALSAMQFIRLYGLRELETSFLNAGAK